MSEFFDASDINVVMSCDHCGSRATFIIRAEYTDFADAPPSGPEKAFTKWYIMQCQECLRPTFAQSFTVVDSTLKKFIWGPKTDILYPAGKTPLTDLPEVVEKKYAEALKVSTISPSSCAVLVRKTLEAICRFENASGRVLADKLRYLADTERIPRTLADVALHLKQLGNLGAHFDEDEVTKEDVPIILDFVELLLEYLYVAPARIETVRKRLNKQN